MEEIKSDKMSYNLDEKEPSYAPGEGDQQLLIENVDGLQRRLSGRQIQMITIGGSIGTALFVSIGTGLTQGGPGSLLIGFVLYCIFLAAVNNCMAEMAVFMPVSGSFVRMGSKWVDEAFGFMLGWNFFLYGELLPSFTTTGLPSGCVGFYSRVSKESEDNKLNSGAALKSRVEYVMVFDIIWTTIQFRP